MAKKKKVDKLGLHLLNDAYKEIATELLVVPTPITKLSVDFTSEQLNNLAMKVNEIIDRLNS